MFRYFCIIFIWKLKPPKHILRHNIGNKLLKCPKHLNNSVIKHNLKLLCASFEENCAKTRTFSNTPFTLRGNPFLSTDCQRFNMACLNGDLCLTYIFR